MFRYLMLFGLGTALVCSFDGRDAKWVSQRLDQIKNSAPSGWRSIPWAASLSEARDRSEKEGRPVFLFTHDGDLETGRC